MPSRFTNADSISTIKKLGGTTIPTGWLECNGASLLTASYPQLFAELGYTYGGAGANFLLPDFRGRTPVCDGTGAGLSPRTRGDTPGAETHTIASANLPTHTHAPGTLAISGGSHTHGPGSDVDLLNVTLGFGSNTNFNNGGVDRVNATPTTAAANHSHPSGEFSGATSNGGFANTAINHLQPSLVVKFIIKAF